MLKHIPLLLIVLLSLGACRSSKHLEKSKHASPEALAEAAAERAEAEARRAAVEAAKGVVENQPEGKALQARLRVEGRLGSQSMTLGGQLRMKRDEVVMLSLTMLGFEVARMEFRPQEVLLVNRTKKTYARAAYADVPFATRAGLDFGSLQAVFWNGLFAPGTPPGEALAAQLGRFALTGDEAGKRLTLTDAPLADYAFTLNPETMRIEALTVRAKHDAAQALSCRYGEPADVAGMKQAFPTHMVLEASAGRHALALDMQLSRLSTKGDFDTETKLSGRYKEVSPEEVIKF